jgi:hypothetical protein
MRMPRATSAARLTSAGPVDNDMVHMAIQQNDESGSPVTWGRHVSDDEDGAAPRADPEGGS